MKKGCFNLKSNQGSGPDNTNRIQMKRTHFRSWKKGKRWLFASSLIVTVIGAGALESGKTVKADSVTPETIRVAAAIDQVGTHEQKPAAQQEPAHAQVSQASVSKPVVAASSAATPAVSQAAQPQSIASVPGVQSVANREPTQIYQTVTTSSAVSSPSSATTYAPTVSPASASVTTSKETNQNSKQSLQTQDIQVQAKEHFDPAVALLGGTDSKGNVLSLDDINLVGTVNTGIPGTYYLRYEYIDPYTQEKLGKNVRVIVKPNTLAQPLENQVNQTSASSLAATPLELSDAASSAPSLALDAAALSSAKSALTSFAKTDQGRIALSEAANKITSGVNFLSAATSLSNDPKVKAFQAQLSEAVATSDVALQKSLVSSFNATAEGSALASLASFEASVASDPALQSMMSSLSSTAEAKSAADASATSSFMATAYGKRLLADASSAAFAGSLASAAAVSSFAQTEDGKQMIAALSSYATNSEFAAFNTALSSAVAASNTSLAQSLATSFFATSLGSAFAQDMARFEATNSYKAMQSAISVAQDSVAKQLRSTLIASAQSVVKADTGFSLTGVLGGITNFIWNAVSWLATNINPIRLIPNLTGLGQVGELIESVIGGTVGSAFYGTVTTAVGGFAAWFIAGVPATVLDSIVGIIPIVGWIANGGNAAELGWVGGITGWLTGIVGSTVGAYYGATMAPGLSKDGKVDAVVSGVALGSTIGGLIGHTLSNWLISYTIGMIVFGIAGVIVVAAGFLGLGPIVNPLVTPLTDTIASLIGSPIGAAIGGIIGGIAGWLLQLVGVKLNLPDAAGVLKGVAQLPGISDLIGTIAKISSKAGKLVTKNLVIRAKQSFDPSEALVSATDGDGKAVDISDLSIDGSVTVSIPGTYILKYYFTNAANNNEIVEQQVYVTVTR
ncbi:KxYKxGKxW signal peptide domain-containing protein [Lacticaseibacillus rhamnosus]|uniref:KxYKxGKxW signal peptide domain-containing protein n=1 Tax=Lacticaseibacillus rhamnosus TaxID=47715 RepID=UPI00325B7B1A